VIAALIGIVALALLGAWLARAPLAEWLLTRYANAQGFAPARLTVEQIDFSGALLRDIRLGSAIRASSAELSYSIESLRDGWLDEAIIDDLDVTLLADERGVELAGKTVEKQIEQLANQFVSIAFIKPMMEQMRNSPFKSEMFSGGSGGDMFQQQLDTVISDRISQRANFPIAKAVYDTLMRGIRRKDSTGEAGTKSNSQANERSDGSHRTERLPGDVVNTMG